jgi:hypothetical protein
LALLGKFRQTLIEHGQQVSLLIVDNAMTSGEQGYSGHGFEGVRVVPGDNSNHEFTGWDAGVAEVLRHGGEPDVWIFTNDTAATHHGWSDNRARRFCVEAEWLSQHSGPWMLGELINCAVPGTTPIGPMLQWIPTYAFAMNGLLRQGLRTLSPDPALLDSMFQDSYEPAHKMFRDHMPPDFMAGAMAWLVADEGEGAERARRYGWKNTAYKVSAFNADTFPLLRSKLRCVLSESFLSQRARQQGADLWCPYSGTTGRRRIRNTFAFLMDRVKEKLILRSQRSKKAASQPPGKRPDQSLEGSTH